MFGCLLPVPQREQLLQVQRYSHYHEQKDCHEKCIASWLILEDIILAPTVCCMAHSFFFFPEQHATQLASLVCVLRCMHETSTHAMLNSGTSSC